MLNAMYDPHMNHPTSTLDQLVNPSQFQYRCELEQMQQNQEWGKTPYEERAVDDTAKPGSTDECKDASCPKVKKSGFVGSLKREVNCKKS